MMNINNYFVTPLNVVVACEDLLRTSDLGRTILHELYPDKVPVFLGAVPASYTAWNQFIPKPEIITNPLVPMLNPIDRFKSICVMLGKTDDIDSFISDIESGQCENCSKLSDDIKAGSTLYKFPEHNAELALALGVTSIADTTVDNLPTLTEEQVNRVSQYFTEDIIIYNSISEAGITVDKPVTLASDTLKTIKKQIIASARYDCEMAGFNLPAEYGNMFIGTDHRTRTLLNAAAARAASDSSYEVRNWKTSTGDFITLPGAMVLVINDAVYEYITNCFTKEAELVTRINNATTVDELNKIRW